MSWVPTSYTRSSTAPDFPPLPTTTSIPRLDASDVICRLSEGADSPGRPAVLVLPGYGVRADEFDRDMGQLAFGLKSTVAVVQFSAFAGSGIRPDYERQSPFSLADHAAEAVAVYRWMVDTYQPDPTQTIVVGQCYGASLATHLTEHNVFEHLVLVTPILYPDEYWNVSRLDFDKERWRTFTRRRHDPQDSRLLAALDRFRGHVQIIGHEADDTVTSVMLDSFRRSCGQASSVFELEVPEVGHAPPASYEDPLGYGDWMNTALNTLKASVMRAIEPPLAPS